MLNKFSHDEEKSCANCKNSYVDDLFYEYCYRENGCIPHLDEDCFPVEKTKCEKWEKESN